MKLKNKKTGQEGNFIINKDHFECVDLDYVPEYRNLAELNAEWEDCEKPKEDYIRVIESFIHYAEEADDSFYCDESVKKFIEKLKAWKRLKDKGFRFELWDYDGGNYQERIRTGRILFRVKDYEEVKELLDTVFGGEE